MATHVDDPFTRTVAGSAFGIEPFSGQTYETTNQGSSVIEVDGSRGKGTIASAWNRLRWHLPISVLNAHMEMTLRSGSASVQNEFMLGLRSTAANNDGICIRVVADGSNIVRGHFRYRDGAAAEFDITTIAAVSGAPAWAAATDWRVIFEIEQASGSNKDLRAKIFRLSDGEPGSWTFTTSTTSGSDSAGGYFGQMVVGAATHNIYVDDVLVRDLDTGVTFDAMGAMGYFG